MSALPKHIEEIHPALWRATQLARSFGKVVDTGYAALSEKLPGGGWPVGALIELLTQQGGIGEIRLLAPALVAASSKRSIAIIQPTHVPNIAGLGYMGIAPERLILLKTSVTADALWSAEQALKTGSFAAVLLWLPHVRAESLRRLHLAAQSSETMFFAMRPLATAQDASPATLRLTLRPAVDGVRVEVIKRKGPTQAEPFIVNVKPSPVLLSPFGRARKPVASDHAVTTGNGTIALQEHDH